MNKWYYQQTVINLTNNKQMMFVYSVPDGRHIQELIDMQVEDGYKVLEVFVDMPIPDLDFELVAGYTVIDGVIYEQKLSKTQLVYIIVERE